VSRKKDGEMEKMVKKAGEWLFAPAERGDDIEIRLVTSA